MAGNGSEQRALQYEQTLVSLGLGEETFGRGAAAVARVRRSSKPLRSARSQVWVGKKRKSFN